MKTGTKPYDSTEDTLEHIKQVRQRLYRVIEDLSIRAEVHDLSKMMSPEKDIFDEYTPRLRGSTYGSDEYKSFLAAMKPALDHHYANNSHHPEFYSYLECNGCFRKYPKDFSGCCGVCGYSQMQLRPSISGMDLLDVIEMLCDWKAATLRHTDGDIRKSIEINQERFGYTDELKQILINTADRLGFFEKDK